MREQFIAFLEQQGFTYHRREEWEPFEVMRTQNLSRTPSPQLLTAVTRDATHYTAAINIPDGDPGEILDGIDGIRRLLIAANWDYLRNRKDGGYRSTITGEWFPGYPLGYSWAYDWLGGIWEINGIEFRPAATSQHNTYTKADLVLTDRADPASDLMLAAVRACRRARRHFGSRAADRPWPHGKFFTETGEGTPTACCGTAVINQINAGLLDMSYQEGALMLAFEERPEDMPPRILDTRGKDPSNFDAFKLRAGKEVTINIKGAKGARAAVVNLTTTRQDAPGFLVAWRGGPRPNESKINFQPNTSIANEVTIPVDSEGNCKIWANESTHVIMDLVGYLKPI